MPAGKHKEAIDCPFLDRRVKLLPCQKEMIVWHYEYTGASISSIAVRFKVSRRMVDFILFPEKYDKNNDLRIERGGSKIYYDRVLHTRAVKEHRDYKRRVLK